MKRESPYVKSARLWLTIAAAVTLTCSSGRAAEVGRTEGGAPAAPVVVRAILIEADSTKASAYVLVENVGGYRLTVPADLSQYVTESYRLGEDGVCVVSRGRSVSWSIWAKSLGRSGAIG